MIEWRRGSFLIVRLTSFASLLAILLLAFGAFAQTSPLVITGTVTEVTVGGTIAKSIAPNEKKAWERTFIYDRTNLYFGIKLQLQFYNRGDTPLIVPVPIIPGNPLPSHFAGTRQILFLNMPSADSVVSEKADEWIPPNTLIRVPELSYLLSLPEPARGFRVIEPGSYYETTEVIRTKAGFKLGVRSSLKKNERDFEYAVPDHPYFKIQYSIAVDDPRPVTEARARWRRWGSLFTTPNGNFFYETDIIINKLADQ